MSLTNTKFLDYIESERQEITNDYARDSIREVANYMEAQTRDCELINPELENRFLEFGATGQDFYSTSLTADTFSAQAVETFDIANRPNTSNKTKVVIITAFEGFTHIPTETASNYTTEERNFNTKARACEKALGTKYVSDVLAFHSTNKTQVWSVAQTLSSGTIAFDGSGDFLTLNQAAQKDNFLAQMDIMFATQGFDDKGYRALASTGIRTAFAEIEKYGLANDKNLQAQLNGLGLDLYTSNKVTATAKWDAYWTRRGAVGQLFALTPSALRGLEGGDTKFYASNQLMPYLGNIPVSMFEITGKTDNTLLSGFKDLTIGTKYGMILKYGFVTNYIADRTATASDILKVNALNS